VKRAAVFKKHLCEYNVIGSGVQIITFYANTMLNLLSHYWRRCYCIRYNNEGIKMSAIRRIQ